MNTPPDLPIQQLDLFADGREQVLRNELAVAVLAGRPEAARDALAALGEEGAQADVLQAGRALVNCLEDPNAGLFLTFEQAMAARDELTGPVREAAGLVLGPAEAAAWARSRWALLARRASALPFQARQEEAHAASLWREAEAWEAMAQAVEGIESWRRQPAPLAWMTLARARLTGTDAAWPLLCELAWLAPARVAPFMRAVSDHALHRLWHRFEAFSDDAADAEGAAWWPAWALVEQPLLLPVMDGAQPGANSPPEQAWQMLRSLLRLERQGRRPEVLAHRQRLRAVHPGLFAAYMRQR